MVEISLMAFDKCVSRPTGTISKGEQSCITNTVNRYLDTM